MANITKFCFYKTNELFKTNCYKTNFPFYKTKLRSMNFPLAIIILTPKVRHVLWPVFPEMLQKTEYFPKFVLQYLGKKYKFLK